MDRFEVALRIRELSHTCWLLVLVAVEAGGVDDGVRDMCRRAGVDGLIHKPVTLPALRTTDLIQLLTETCVLVCTLHFCSAMIRTVVSFF